MPKGGLRKLIAVLLQFVPRKTGNCAFIGADFRPLTDQWQCLSTIRRTPVDAAEEIGIPSSRWAILMSKNARSRTE